MKINNKLIVRDMITINMSSTYSIPSTSTTYTLPNMAVLNKIGDKLWLSNNKVVVGSGVKKVKVQYSARCGNGSNTTRTFTYLRHNSTDLTQDGAYFSASSQNVTNTSNALIISVSEGDTFYINVNGYAGNSVSGYLNNTTLTVEVVEYD